MTTFLDFTDIYKDYNMSLYGKDARRIDLTGIRGTDMYCDEKALTSLMDRIRPAGPGGIHFLDSGNYHYMSRLYTDLICQPFSLAVFDNHTDMQPSMIDELLSCGSWLRSALRRNPHLRSLLLIGPPAENIREDLTSLYKDAGSCPDEKNSLLSKKILTISREELACQLPLSSKDSASSVEPGFPARLFPVLKDLDPAIPVYLSIDKDVLSEDWAVTNWDQGQLSLPDLLPIVQYLSDHYLLLGADICGEMGRPSYADPASKKADPIKASLLNKQTNLTLYKSLISFMADK